jgi:Na+-transporting NADH:ubiquinone oxidoreductase subunit C
VSKEGAIRKRIFTVLFMFLVTLVFISITTVIYTLSKDTIKFNEALRLKKAVLYAAGVSVSEQPQEIEQEYKKRVEEVLESDGSVKYYIVHGEDGPSVESYVVVTKGPGLWGDITVAIGYDETRSRISGIEIIDQNETPGLGGRIGEEWFKGQFRNKSFPLSTVAEGETAGDREFQAITGATYSSNSIKDIVNSVSEKIPSLLNKE